MCNFFVSHGFRSLPSSNILSSMGGTGYGNILLPSPSDKPLRLPCGCRVCPALNGSPVGGFITLVCRAESEFVLLSAVLGRRNNGFLSMEKLLDQFLLQLGSGGGDRYAGLQ